MKYAIQLSLKKFTYNLKHYIAISLQFAIGICLIFVAFNMQFTAAEQLNRAENQTPDNLVKITGDMTYADFLKICDSVSIPEDTELIYYKSLYVYFYKNGQQFPIHVYYVDNLFYKYIVGNDTLIADTVYAGKNVISLFQGDGVKVDKYNAEYFDETTQNLLGTDISTWKELKGARYTMPPMEYEMSITNDVVPAVPTFDDSVFIPIDYADSAVDNPQFSTLYVTLVSRNSEITENYCIELCKALRIIHPDIDYNYNYYNGWISGIFIEMENYAFCMKIISVIVFVITFYGLSGILLLAINKRKRDMSIAIICGASKRKVFIELFSEVTCIIFSGMLLGIIIGTYISPIQFIQNQVVANYSLSYIACIGITFVLDVVVCLFGLFSIRCLAPLETIYEG